MCKVAVSPNTLFAFLFFFFFFFFGATQSLAGTTYLIPTSWESCMCKLPLYEAQMTLRIETVRENGVRALQSQGSEIGCPPPGGCSRRKHIMIVDY